MKRKSNKKYPMDGPPTWIQKLRQKGSNMLQSERRAIRKWVREYKENPNYRPETVAAYTV